MFKTKLFYLIESKVKAFNRINIFQLEGQMFAAARVTTSDTSYKRQETYTGIQEGDGYSQSKQYYIHYSLLNGRQRGRDITHGN